MKSDNAIQRLRWLMLSVMLFDLLITLVGQPMTYWQNPATALEGDPIVRLVMHQGLLALILVSVLYGAAMFVLVSRLPRQSGLIVLLILTLWHYYGASTWFDRYFQSTYGALIYGALLAALFVGFGLDIRQTPPQTSKWPMVLSALVCSAGIGTLALISRRAIDGVTPIAQTEERMRVLSWSIISYVRAHGQLPASLDDLPKTRTVTYPTNDAWNRPIAFEFSSSGTFTLRSLGRDGVAGGSGDDHDIVISFPYPDTHDKSSDGSMDSK
jgi:type II secretion system (T2SS) protein G